MVDQRRRANPTVRLSRGAKAHASTLWAGRGVGRHWWRVGEVRAGDVADGAADEDVGEEMFFGGKAGEGDGPGSSVERDLLPLRIGVPGEHRGNGETHGSVAGGERASAGVPEISLALEAVGT